MKLFYVPGTCSLASHITLREVGAPFDLELVDRTTKKTKSGLDYNTVNPKGYVPALQLDDGQVLTENVAILAYLADQSLGQNPNLAPPAGALDRYRYLEMLTYLSSEVHKGYNILFQGGRPTTSSTKVRDRLMMRLKFLAERLGGQPWLLGKHFSGADAYLFAMLRWSERTQVPIAEIAALPAFMGRAAASGRPFRAALEAEGLPA